MIKNNNNSQTYKEIAHTISSLYKIKEINRRIIYQPNALKSIILNTSIGQEVISQLKKLEVTRAKLIKYNLVFFDSILGDQFPKK